MYGTAWIGDSSENQATSDTLTPSGSDTGCANTATKGGGIYNDGGIVALGYDAYTDAISNSPKDFTGGVGRNYASLFGGGIYGKFTISGGSVSYNKSYFQGGGLYIPQNVTDAKITGGSITHNSAQSDGGAAYINGNAKLSMSGNADISNNSAYNRGGGIFIYDSNCTFEMSGGSFASNTATGAGGAIYQGGDFIMSGSALITPGGSEKSNDVYLPLNKSFTVASTTLNGGTTVAAITLDNFRRGRQILNVSTSITLSEAELNTIKGKIALTEDGWNKENIIIGSVYAGVKINSPIYVASTAASDSTRKVCSPGVTSGAKGTSAKPYATIAAALGASDLAVAGNKITIDGTIGKQEIAPSASLSAVTIAGYKAGSDTTSSAKIDAGGTTGAGSALTVNKSGLTVTITDLTITGGTGTEVSSTLYGGGIYINNGNVQLTNGAVVNGNSAAIGGGVYLNAGNLYINGSAVVGKPGVTECAQNVSGKYGNKAATSGGGIGVQNGTLWLGYTPPAGSSTTPAAAETSGGVLYNLVCSGGERHGGGIDNNSGTLNIAHGYVSYNYACSTGTGDNDIGCGGGISTAYVMKLSGDAEISHNKSANGGGVYITCDSTNGSFTMEGGKVTLNESEAQHEQYGYGGGVAIGPSGSFTLAGGEVSSNEAAVDGGAVWHNGAGFEIKGTATKIPAGTNDSNNIAVFDHTKLIKVTGATSHGNGEIAVTPGAWKRGTQIFTNDSTSTYFSKFKLTDPEWSIVAYNEGSITTGRIDADIYVASSLTTGHNRATGISAPSSTESERRGTMARPYSSISEAVNACWAADRDFTIHLSGIIEESAQSIPAADTTAGTALAKSITLEGVQGNTKDIINRKLLTATDSGMALAINTATPVTIKKIKITGGYNNNASGGGIYACAAGASLTLSEGALVTANNLSVSGTTYTGAGVYIEGTSASPATFIMESDATISGNNAGSGGGGGVGLKYATLCMTGSALIGDKDATSAATGDSGKHSNSAQSGGGVYVGTGSKLRLGYATPTATTGTSLDAAYGIRYNYVYNAGGGVLVASGSSVEIASGSISCNGTIANEAYKNGGGIYLNETATLTMTGGTIAKNKAYDGGGVYLYGNTSTGSSIVMSGGTIGDSSSGVTSAATGSDEKFSNYAAHNGGGIYAATAKNTVTLNGGNVSYNYSTEQGGGIWTAATTTMGAASIKYNSAVWGGGVYTNGAFTMNNNNAAISNNNASNGGGGVYIEGGTFTMSAGTIGDSGTKSSAAESDASKHSNSSGSGGGGGVFVKAGTVRLNGGVVGYNYSDSFEGGGINFKGGSLIVKNNVQYNTAKSAGGLSISANNCTLDSATFTKNVATQNGGAVFVNKGYTLNVKGNLSMPNPSKGTNDIMLQYNSNYALINVTGDLGGSDPVAMITPNGYYDNKVVVTAGSGVSIATVSQRFSVLQDTSSTKTWLLDTSGNLRGIWGTKLAPDKAGDVVYSDGSAMDGSSATIKNPSMAIAVIFYKSGSTMKGLGLKESNDPLKLGISDPVCQLYSKAATLTSSASDGSVNMTKVKSLSDANTTANFKTNYPGFYWASAYSSSATNLGVTYSSGWYIPAKDEMSALLSKLSTINTTIDKIGTSYATKVEPSNSKFYCTSTWASNGWVNYAKSTSGVEPDTNGLNGLYYIRAIRTF